jgi:membrane carboxypeptidase/penicillin-binding protein PbpC
MTANAWCPSRVSEWVAAEAERLPCSWHHQTDEGLLVVWPPQYRAWAADHGLFGSPERRLSGSPEGLRDANNSTAPTAVAQAFRPALEIVSPPEGATYLIDPTLRREFQTLPLRATTAGGGSIEWRINGKTVGRTSIDEPLMWPLRPGEHVVSARDRRGRTAEATILVK